MSLNQPVANPEEIVVRRRFDMQRLAWGVVLLAFAIFCVMCVVAGLGVNYFLFQSVVPLDATMQVGRGSSGVNGQFVVARRDLSNSDEMVTAPQSQAVISFRDPYQAGAMIASVTTDGNTSLVYRRALRPRFEWSSNSYIIELEAFAGELDVFIPPDLPRSILLSVRSIQGDRAYFSSAGHYLVDASEERMRVVNLDGDVVLIAADEQTTRHIPAGKLGVIYNTEAVPRIEVADGYVDLLSNLREGESAPVETEQGDILAGDLLLSWACTNNQEDLPRGSFTSELDDGHSVLRLVRAGDATKNGETRCQARTINPTETIDVSGYDYLALRATFKINFQSLSVCGVAGSECPMMLRIDYLDVNGDGQRWFHGFYYHVDPQRSFPLRCDSCTLEHEQVIEKAWYTYDTGNLLALIGANIRPQNIVAVYFYASGHQYDVEVSDVFLLAAKLAVTDSTDESGG
ncbi:MAG: hypothetical protein H6672_09645 [Anaerolineaceae bacterium]|nr:hypothetical protein [Anaerolineaceae bacterium]